MKKLLAVLTAVLLLSGTMSLGAGGQAPEEEKIILREASQVPGPFGHDACAQYHEVRPDLGIHSQDRITEGHADPVSLHGDLGLDIRLIGDE